MSWPRRTIAAPFVVPPPSGARVRTRLRPSAEDETVLLAVGRHLGRLAGVDLADRARRGRADAGRTARKRGLTAASSSRWAGAITRTSDAQWNGRTRLYESATSIRRSLG